MSGSNVISDKTKISYIDHNTTYRQLQAFENIYIDGRIQIQRNNMWAPLTELRKCTHHCNAYLQIDPLTIIYRTFLEFNAIDLEYYFVSFT